MKAKLCVISTIESTLENFVIPSMRRFVQEGYSVTLICSMSEDFKKRYSGEFQCIDVRMKRGICLRDILLKPFEFYRIFKKEKFDYVQYATTNASFYAGIAARLLKIPTRVYCSWGLLYESYTGLKRKIFVKVEKFLCDSATDITVASHKNLEIAVRDGVLSRDRDSVVGDGGTVGVDLAVFYIAKREAYKAEVLGEYPVLKGKTVFGYVGRIETDKGVGELLEAFLEMNDPSSALLLIGPFDSIRCNLDASLLERARKADNIIFHGFSREVPKYMSSMDIFVLPTYREGFSMVLQQAMAMGVAIITTDVPGPSEVIEEGLSGLLVPPCDAASLCAAMKSLRDDKALQEKYIASALVRVKEKFTRERMIELTYRNRIEMMQKNKGL